MSTKDIDDFNSGNHNSGNFNSGNYNSGNKNSGNWNTGYKNIGDFNVGYFNSGNHNTGSRNSGNWNSGDFNLGDGNTGFFNTNKPKIMIFNKETDVDCIEFPFYFYFELTEWICEDEMTESEKKENSEYATNQGYLKVYSYKEAWLKSFNENCDKSQARKTINLPNFDYFIFEKITGINKKMLEDKLETNQDIDVDLDDLSKESLINILRKMKKDK